MERKIGYAGIPTADRDPQLQVFARDRAGAPQEHAAAVVAGPCSPLTASTCQWTARSRRSGL
ncbi:MAG TPA: hypothetical protein VGL46_09120 [Pseudonocardiaceae bacterium]